MRTPENARDAQTGQFASGPISPRIAMHRYQIDQHVTMGRNEPAAAGQTSGRQRQVFSITFSNEWIAHLAPPEAGPPHILLT